MSGSNIGRALEKIIGAEGENDIAVPRYDNTIRQRRFEYEDGVIARSVEAREQIMRMAQPFVFSAEELDAQHIIVRGDHNPVAASLLKDLRNRVTLKKSGLGATVLVTSIGETSQSSYLARNLAATIASDESRTSLLLELKKTGSMLTKKESVPVSFSSFINDDAIPAGEVIHPTGVPRMRVIPFGDEEFLNYEYLRSTRTRILIKDVTRRYPRERFTIIDAPPIDDVSDVELLNEYADQIILCLPYGKISESKLKKGLLKIDKNKLLGTVLSGTPRMKRLSAKAR